MAKTNNLKDYLTDLYEGIVSKKPNASRNPQDFRREIESISGGATIKSGGGTNVVNGQFVEKLYINNNLSIEELYAICDTLDFFEERKLYNVFYSEDATKALQILDLRNVDGEDYGVIIAYVVQGDQPQVELIFSSSPLCAEFTGIDFTDGWYNTSKDFYIEVNANADEDGIVEEIGFQINPQDTSQLVSTTPFTKEEIELSGEYDGSTIEVTDLSGGWQGTVVPNTGYVENVYFNTELSVEEVVSILNQITTYIDDTYQVCATEKYDTDYSASISIMKAGNIYMVYYFDKNDNGAVLFHNSSYDEADIGFIGFNPEFANMIEFNANFVSEFVQFTNVGAENDKLSSLFSTTPFTRTEENTINIKKYIDNKKIPLSIKVNVESAGGEQVRSIKKYLDVKQSCYQMFKSLKTITNVDDILEYNDTENVTTISYMFADCWKLQTLPRLNTNKVTNMSYAFYCCSDLKKIDISHYNISSTSNASKLCTDDYILKAVIIRSFGSDYVLNSNSFENCKYILGISHPTINPTGAKDGFIYVPRNMVDTLKSATNWSTYADQIRALEDYTKDGTTTGEFDDAKAGLV